MAIMIDDFTVDQARNVDLLALAAQHTELHKESKTESSGPCPRCGGDDRFHVTETGFFCRNRACWPDGAEKFGDPISFVRWLHGVDFAGAIEILTGNVAAPRTRPAPPMVKATPTPKQHSRAAVLRGWAAKIGAMVSEAQARAEAAAAYMATRGIDFTTALAYGIGFRPDAPLPGSWDAHKRTHTIEPQPAIVIPWWRGFTLVAVRYRFLQYHTYTDTDGKERSVKQSSVYDSDFRGVLYGGHVLPDFCRMPIDDNGRCAEQLRTLVLCEGELNAMSIWQVMHAQRWDVLSVGSESHKMTDAARSFADRYERVIVWMDKPEAVKRMISQLGNAIGISSPVIGDKEHDANDLLRTGQLFDFLLEARRKGCKSEEERERVKWNLEDINYG